MYAKPTQTTLSVCYRTGLSKINKLQVKWGMTCTVPILWIDVYCGVHRQDEGQGVERGSAEVVLSKVVVVVSKRVAVKKMQFYDLT